MIKFAAAGTGRRHVPQGANVHPSAQGPGHQERTG